MFAAKKHLIKSIGANKTEQSISRVTRSADAIYEICSYFDSSILLNPKSGRHSKTVPEADEIRLFKKLRKLRPFPFTHGRVCDGFQDIGHVPLKLEDFPKFNCRIHKIISRLTRGFIVAVEEEDYENLDNLQPI